MHNNCKDAVENVVDIADDAGNKLSKAEIIKQNKIAGKAAEEIAKKQLVDEGYEIIGSQVSARTSAGRRVMDYLVRDPLGNMISVEVKLGNAVRSKMQLLKDSLLATEGGFLTGKNAGEFSGKFIQIQTIEMRIPR